MRRSLAHITVARSSPSSRRLHSDSACRPDQARDLLGPFDIGVDLADETITGRPCLLDFRVEGREQFRADHVETSEQHFVASVTSARSGSPRFVTAWCSAAR